MFEIFSLSIELNLEILVNVFLKIGTCSGSFQNLPEYMPVWCSMEEWLLHVFFLRATDLQGMT